MLQVAPILGYDPSSADRRGVARYRSRGSLKIDFDRGTFADFEAGIAGGVLDFIQHATGEDACTWLERQGLASLGSYPFRARGVRETADLGAQFRELSDREEGQRRPRSGNLRASETRSTLRRRSQSISPPAADWMSPSVAASCVTALQRCGRTSDASACWSATATSSTMRSPASSES